MSKFQILKDALQQDGWSVAPQPLESDCWWAKGIWKLESAWTPQGLTLYVSLLLDPQNECDKNNPPETEVWALNLCTENPQSGLSPNTISVGRHPARAFREAVKLASDYRANKASGGA